jgi:hypothetical protein
LEQVRAVKDVVRNGCITHKAEQNNAEHQPTNYTKRDAEFSKENPDLWSRESMSQALERYAYLRPLFSVSMVRSRTHADEG